MAKWNMDDSPSTARVAWTLGANDDPHQDSGVCSLSEWIEDNKDGICLSDLRTLLTHGSLEGGGGAAPVWNATLTQQQSPAKGGA